MSGPGLFAFTDRDSVTVGNWTASTGTDRWAMLDEWMASLGADRIQTPNNSDCDVVVIGLSDVADPGEDDNARLYTFAHKNNANGQQVDMTVTLLDGSTRLGGAQFTNLSNTTTGFYYALTTGEASGITSSASLATDLNIEFICDTPGGGQQRQLWIEAFQFRWYYKSSAITGDDFETNTEIFADTDAAVGATATAVISTDAAIGGTYGLDVTANNAADSNNEDNFNYRFGSPGDPFDSDLVIVADFDFKWRSWTQGGYNTAISKGPIQIRNNSPEPAAWLRVSGTRQLGLAYKASDGTNTSVSGTHTFDTDVQYDVILRVDKSGANPIIQFKVDNVVIASATDTTSGTSGVGGGLTEATFPWEARIGLVHNGQFEKMQYAWDIDNFGIYVTEPASDVAGPAATIIPQIMYHRRRRVVHG